MKEEWEGLKHQEEIDPRNYNANRHGLIASANNKDGMKYRCQACLAVFVERLDARTHSCPDEVEFREFTRRPATDAVSLPSLNTEVTTSANTKNQDVIEWRDLPEEWVRWNAGLLNEIDNLRRENQNLIDLTSKQTIELANAKAGESHYKELSETRQVAHANEAQRLSYGAT